MHALPVLIAALALGASCANARPIVVRPFVDVHYGEEVALRFEGGPTVELGWFPDGWRADVPDGLLGRPYGIVRNPGAVPEVGLRGQGIPPRSVPDLPGLHAVQPVAFQDRLPAPGTSTRSGRFEDLSVPSALVGSPRTVRVHLPRAYDASPGQRFPLVLCLDGQNVVDAAASFGGVEWGLDEAARRIEESGGPAFVLAAVDNGGGRRLHEYTFCAGEAMGQVQGGGAEEHLRFLREAVLPALRARYRLDGAPPRLVGSSLGGLFGLWVAHAYPDDVTAVAALSPSVWWSGCAVLRLRPPAGPRRPLWLDIGADEGEEAVRGFENARRRLGALGWREGQELRTLLVPGARHTESAWADRGEAVLRWLLQPGPRP